jgi:hypothetical protein
MNPSEQAALIQFFGTMHAEAKQTDQRIVGNSQFVRPISTDIQQSLERALATPVQHTQQMAPINTGSHPLPPTNFYQPEPITSLPDDQLNFLNLLSESPKNNVPVQVTPQFNCTELVEALTKINLALTRIGDILESDHGRKKTTKASKFT